MKKRNLILCVVYTLVCSMGAGLAHGLTVTLNYDDSCTAMGSLIDDDGDPITDFSLSWYKLVEPGLGEPFTIRIDVTESMRQMLDEGADFAGYVISASSDGEFCLASLDLIDDTNDKSYLPTLVLVADFYGQDP